MLPLYHTSQKQTSKTPGSRPTRLANVWDSREEVFEIGDDDDDEDIDVARGKPSAFSSPPAAPAPAPGVGPKRSVHFS